MVPPMAVRVMSAIAMERIFMTVGRSGQNPWGAVNRSKFVCEVVILVRGSLILFVLQRFGHILHGDTESRGVVQDDLEFTRWTQSHVEAVESGDFVGINGRCDKLSEDFIHGVSVLIGSFAVE
jgi:hypothetical protein